MHRILLAPEWLAVPLAVVAFSVVASSWFMPEPRPEPVPETGKVIPPPADTSRPHQILLASWYGEDHRGRLTASGVPFDPDALTCAHPYLPFGTRLRLELDAQVVVVTVNDRGPYVGGRDLDLSYGAARRLGMLDAGLALVDVQVLP